MDRRVPKLRLGSNRDDVAAEDAIDPRTWVEFDETFLPTLGAAAVAIVLLAVVLPLLGVALQLILLLLLLSSGIVGRVVLRKPWVIEAINLDHPERSVAFAVKGWRRSSEAIEELTGRLAAGGPPSQLSESVGLVPVRTN